MKVDVFIVLAILEGEFSFVTSITGNLNIFKNIRFDPVLFNELLYDINTNIEGEILYKLRQLQWRTPDLT